MLRALPAAFGKELKLSKACIYIYIYSYKGLS